MPVLFEGSQAEPIGFFYVGNELLPASLPWNQRLFSIPEGRVAMKATISLAQASSGAWAGLRFRSEIPTSGAASIHEAYAAAGYSFNVNKQGVLELLRQDGSGGSQRLWGGQVNNTAAATINSVGGLQLEVRTHNTNPGWMQMLVNGQVVGEVIDPAPVLGEHSGLVASTSSGRVRFGNREVFDVSYQHQTTYTLYTDGMLDVDMRLQLAPGVTSPHPVNWLTQHIYLNTSAIPADQRAVWGTTVDGVRDSNLNGQIRSVSPAADGFDALWAGNSAGTFGLHAQVLHAEVNGQPADGAHALLAANDSQLLMHINALPHSANTTPVADSGARLQLRFGSRA